MKKKNDSVRRRSMFQESMMRLVRNKTAMLGFTMFAFIVCSCLCANFICPEGYDAENIACKRIPPGTPGFFFGTDDLGRSMLARILYGGRYSVLIGVVSTALAAFLGIILGAISGYFGGWLDNLIMRVLDVFSAIPIILMAIAISTSLGTGLFNAMLAVGMASVPAFARTVRGPILSVKEQEYVEAAKSIDASTARIIFKHVLPNVLSPIIVMITLSIGSSTLVAASLSFLGLGVKAPIPEWGGLIASARKYIAHSPYLVTMPGIALSALVLSINLFGDGLRDALDPRLKD